MLTLDGNIERARSEQDHRGRAQARRCRALLSAVISLAIDDACIEPTRQERRVRRNLHVLAVSGLHFLFHPESTLVLYAQWLDLDPENIRLALRRRAWTDPTLLNLRSRLEWLGPVRLLESPAEGDIEKLADRWRSVR